MWLCATSCFTESRSCVWIVRECFYSSCTYDTYPGDDLIAPIQKPLISPKEKDTWSKNRASRTTAVKKGIKMEEKKSRRLSNIQRNLFIKQAHAPAHTHPERFVVPLMIFLFVFISRNLHQSKANRLSLFSFHFCFLFEITSREKSRYFSCILIVLFCVIFHFFDFALC